MSNHTATSESSPQEAATRFFWAWLIAATVASILGNVTHAVLGAASSPVIAAAAAIVPPVVLLGATHGVHALVRSRIVGAAYRTALAIVIALAVCAFVLSYEALRELAIVYAGMRPSIAWLWPLAIDLSITGSTVALLALTGQARGAQAYEVEHLDAHPLSPVAPVHVSVHTSAQAVAQAAAVEVAEPATDLPVEAAERLLDAGVTRIDRVKVAQVLAEHAEGTAPSMIARKLSVGYSTVVRILEHHTAHAAQAAHEAAEVTA
ncbi:LamD-like protein [Mycobacterium phage Marcoliusprime]|nr:LamD-like protein [Mycobacterium phage Marcoliusprime]ASR86625.1 LamD-like protein [Mycobacterium phage DismalFunk]AYB69035.1 LamD-like protein [Mycobacterium phage DismalStressor]